MKTVNPYFLDVFLRPLAGLGDDEEAVKFYQEMNLVTEDDYRRVIKDTLVEDFNRLDEEKKRKSKVALSYCLTKPVVDFEGIFNASLLPFDPPEDARNFFVWLWTELFKKESYIMLDVESYHIVSDVNEPNRPTLKQV